MGVAASGRVSSPTNAGISVPAACTVQRLPVGAWEPYAGNRPNDRRKPLGGQIAMGKGKR